MRRRTVFAKDRSLYLNLPKEVVDAAGLKAGDDVDVRYIEGIGIIVAFPIRIPVQRSKSKRKKSFTIKKYGREFFSLDGEFLEVIPLHDSLRSKN